MSAKVKDRLADYIPVNERLEKFYSDHPSGRVLTSVLEHSAEQGFILMRAEIYRSQEDALPAATGHAFEERSQGYVNPTSYIENCETSAVGRGLALLGYEIKRGIASLEEMQKVERMSGQIREVKKPTQRDALLEGVGEACKLLNAAGDVPPWTPARLREYVRDELGAASIDDLGIPEIEKLLKALSIRHDSLKNQQSDLSDMPTVTKCDCGIERVRVDGIAKSGPNKGKPYSMWACANRVKEHKPIFINAEDEEPQF